MLTDPSLWPWAAWGWGAVAAVGLTTTVWLFSVVRRDVSIIDPFWGLAIFMVPSVAALVLNTVGPRAFWTLALAGGWAMRLGLHLAPRIFESEEDRRYAEMRAAAGQGFWLRSLVTVFWLQAALASAIAWPLVVAVVSPRPIGWVFPVGVVLVVAGALIEAVADGQLARFRASPASGGKVLNSGLWRYSRHPNYFGDAVLWWGFGLIGAGASGSPLPLLASLLMTGLLLRVSGVPLLEPHLESTRPGYREYAARTSAFILWPPRDIDA